VIELLAASTFFVCAVTVAVPKATNNAIAIVFKFFMFKIDLV
jgi:hypothetical protein